MLDIDPIGIDIEKITDIDFKMADRYFSKEEYEYINVNERGKLDRFYEIWTFKESYIKVIGKGLSMLLNSFSVINNNTMFYNDIQYNFHKFDIDDNYKMSVCSVNTSINTNIIYVDEDEFIDILLKFWRNKIEEDTGRNCSV